MLQVLFQCTTIFGLILLLKMNIIATKRTRRFVRFTFHPASSYCCCIPSPKTRRLNNSRISDTSTIYCCNSGQYVTNWSCRISVNNAVFESMLRWLCRVPEASNIQHYGAPLVVFHEHRRTTVGLNDRHHAAMLRAPWPSAQMMRKILHATIFCSQGHLFPTYPIQNALIGQRKTCRSFLRARCTQASPTKYCTVLLYMEL